MIHDANNKDCNYDETKPSGSQLCNEIYNYCTCPSAVNEIKYIRQWLEQCFNYGLLVDQQSTTIKFQSNELKERAQIINGKGAELQELRAELAAAQSELAAVRAENLKQRTWIANAQHFLTCKSWGEINNCTCGKNELVAE